MEAIARRAEISVATLYALFDGKRDIYKATISRAHDQFFVEIRARVAETRGPLEQMRAIISYHLENFSRNARSFRAFARSTNVAGMELKNEVEREATSGKREFYEMVVDICARGLDEGVFRRGLPATELTWPMKTNISSPGSRSRDVIIGASPRSTSIRRRSPIHWRMGCCSM